MNTKRISIITLTIFAALIIGTAAILSQAPATLGANVAWDPKTWTFDSPPDPWNSEVSLKGGHKAQTEIDPATILLESTYSPSGTPTNATHGPRLIVPFAGMDVKSALASKIPQHMGVLIPGTYRIQLVISGYLKPAYGSLPWSGDGVITVTVLPPA
jgi:hypothetical protein